jgi:hypothetical protein
LFGLFPALQASRTDLSSTIKESTGRGGTSFRHNKARSLLVITETALALILLIGAALLLRTFTALRAVSPGFDSHNVLTLRMSLSGPRFVKTAGVDQLVRQGTERLKALPGVETAGATCCVPLEGGYTGAERDRILAAYFVPYPDGRERLAWKGITHFRVRPTWIRYSDFNAPQQVVEFK